MDQYECNFCKKTYRQKFSYDQHKLCCEFFYKSKREQDYEIEDADEKIPSQRDMYRLMKNMMMRIDKLEQENSKLKQNQRTTVNVLDWLNKSPNQPNITFFDWMKEKILPKVHTYLEIVFTEDLITGIIQVIEDAIASSLTDEIPLRIFENRNNIFYIYKNEKSENKNTWVQITNTMFDKYMSAISNHFVTVFDKYWVQVNKDKIERDETYKEMYLNYNNKVCSDNDTTYKRIREHVQKRLTQNVQRCREYDII